MIPRPHPAVISKPVSEGTVLLHTDTEIYFGLNRVGAQIWELLGGPAADLDTVLESLSSTYPDVDPEVLRADIEALVEQLKDNGLLVDADDNDAAPPASS
jgi:hypothetical protein